jgi:hypothetical protein
VQVSRRQLIKNMEDMCVVRVIPDLNFKNHDKLIDYRQHVFEQLRDAMGAFPKRILLYRSK